MTLNTENVGNDSAIIVPAKGNSIHLTYRSKVKRRHAGVSHRSDAKPVTFAGFCARLCFGWVSEMHEIAPSIWTSFRGL